MYFRKVVHFRKIISLPIFINIFGRVSFLVNLLARFIFLFAYFVFFHLLGRNQWVILVRGVCCPISLLSGISVNQRLHCCSS